MGADLVGKTLGHYRIVEKIGEGGMGVVYRATDEKLHRAVAVKVLSDDLTKDDERRRRFLREARVAAGLNHPNIATVHDVGEADGRIYIAMELVEGASLRERLASGALKVATAIGIAKDLARALMKAHEKGIVHRDLKPDNIMVSDDLAVKVLDFGLAKPLDVENTISIAALGDIETAAPQLTGEGRILGTPGYMSPEQTTGRAIDARTDVFALGVVLYEMVTGTRPFRGPSGTDVIIATNRDAPVPPSKLREALAPAIDAIILRCLEKKAESRYATARALLVDLDAVGAVSSDAPSKTPSGKDAAAVPVPSLAAMNVRAATPVEKEGVRSPVRGRRTRLWVGLGLSVAIAAGVVVARQMTARNVPANAGAATPSGSTVAFADAGEGAGVAMTSFPPPESKSQEAITAYRRGIQLFHDGSIAIGADALVRAVNLDPTMAAASLRLSLYEFMYGPDGRRRYFSKASPFRAALSERDQMLLSVVEARVIETAAEEPVLRARAAVARFPLDAEIAFVLGVELDDAGRLDEADDAYDRARSLDPSFATPLWSRSTTAYGRRDFAGGVREASKCIALSPTAASCLRMRASISSLLGECPKCEEDARRMVAVEPDGPGAYEWLAATLAARDGPTEAIHALLMKSADLRTDEHLPGYARAEYEMKLALRAGSFVAAVSHAAEIEKIARSSTDESAHAETAGYLMEMHLESGNEAKALAVADDYARHRQAWSTDGFFSGHALMIAIRHRAGHMSQAAFEVARSEGIAKVKSSLPGGLGAIRAWELFDAYPAASAAEAAEALSRAPKDLPNLLDGSRYLGNLYLLLGQPEKALASLVVDARDCQAALVDPLGHIRARYRLGRALDATGDVTGACAAYAYVLAHWGNAKPRSVTADAARERAKALSCAPPDAGAQ